MPAIQYLKGFLKNFTNKRISKLALIDDKSIFQKTTKIYHQVKIVQSSIDSYTYVAPKTQVVYATIGKYCSIGPECLIGLPKHSLNNISTSPIFSAKNNAVKYQWIQQNTFNEFEQVRIGSDVWIGSRAIIMGGVKIGHGAAIGAGSIVTKDIPDYAIAVGVPARIIKYRFEEPIIKKLLEIEWWNMPVQLLKGNIQIFSKSKIRMDDLEEFLVASSNSQTK